MTPADFDAGDATAALNIVLKDFTVAILSKDMKAADKILGHAMGAVGQMITLSCAGNPETAQKMVDLFSSTVMERTRKAIKEFEEFKAQGGVVTNPQPGRTSR